MSASVSTETAKRRAALVAAIREAAQGVEPQRKLKSLISTLKRRDAHLLHSDGPGIVCCGTPAAAEEGDLKDPRFHKSRNGFDTICSELLTARRTLRHQTPKGRLKFWREGFAFKNLNHTGHRANGSCGCAQKYKRIPEPGVPIAATERHGFTTLDSKSVPHIHQIAALALHRRLSRLLYEWKIGLKGYEHLARTEEYEEDLQHGMDWLGLPTDGERSLSSPVRRSVTCERDGEPGRKRRRNS